MDKKMCVVCLSIGKPAMLTAAWVNNEFPAPAGINRFINYPFGDLILSLWWLMGKY